MLHHQTRTCLASRFLELSCSPRKTDFLMIACIATFCRPRLVITGPPWFWLWFHTTSAASFSRAFSKEPCGLRMPARLSAKAEVQIVNTQVRMYVSCWPDYKNYKGQNIKFKNKQLIFLWDWRFSIGVPKIQVFWDLTLTFQRIIQNTIAHYQSCVVLLFTCLSTHRDLQAVDYGAQQWVMNHQVWKCQ